MKKSFAFFSSVLLIVFCFSVSIFAQDTTGEIQGTVKDPAGAVVPNASITIKGVDVGFNRNIQSDENGFYRARQIPPGNYNVSVAAISGFVAQVQNNIQVALGNATTVDFTLATSAVTGEVTVTDESGVIVDPTETKAQDNISAREIEALPKGTGFTSLLRTTASVRPEPLSGQFSINGSSGPENSFIIDGQETQNFRTGVLNGNNDVPFQAVQEIQVKSSGFEAEFGGATGGVINAVSKSGTNEFRGEVGANFGTTKLDAGPRSVLNTYLSFGPEVIGSRPGSAQGVEYLPQARDRGHAFFPTATLGGPIVKDRLWFFGIYSPRQTVTTRTTNFIEGFGSCTAPLDPNLTYAPCRRPVTISPAVTALAGAATTQSSTLKRTVEYSQIKLDASPVDSLRLSSSFTWNPIVDRGALLGGSYVASTPSFGVLGGQTFQGADLAARQGGRQNSNNFRVEGNWAPNSKLVTTLRYTRGFLNERLGAYGIPAGTRIRCRAASAAASTAAGCLTGYQNTNNNFQNDRDVSIRNTFDANASYLVSNLGGRHEFKGGYQFSKISNDVSQGTALNGGITHLYYNSSPTPALTNLTGFVCNGAWAPAATVAPEIAIGRGCNQQFGTIGKASNVAHTLFIQDKWQPTNRLTLNLGVRTENEKIPSFNGVTNTGLEFKFAEKIAPRLGAAYALTGDGKTKISAFYGWFFDRLKFELPRGSFGGDFYHVDFFYIQPNNTNQTFYTLSNIIGNFPRPQGGQCPVTGAGTLVRCDTDYRIPSNIGFPGAGAVDPNLKPFRQSEFTVEFQREVMRASVFTARYLRRNVDHAVEDAGSINSVGSEAYIIGNPGEGLHAQTLKDAGYAKIIKPVRKYNAMQLELDTRYFRNFNLNFNYTLSRLYGNYSGLGSADENGRTSPNVDRDFDLPFVGFTASGQEALGVLGLDRTHVFKASGTYTFDWFESKTNSTDVSFFTTLQSGLPQTTFADIFGIPIPLTKRNDLGRTEMFTQTDLNLSHKYRFGRDDRFGLAFDFNVLNVFNENNVLGLNNSLTQSSYYLLDFCEVDPAGCNAPSTNYVAAVNILTSKGVLSQLNTSMGGDPFYSNQAYKQPNQFQAPRSVRFGVRLLF